MAHGEHKYAVSVRWTGNRGSGTSGYRDYGRDHLIAAGSKPEIPDHLTWRFSATRTGGIRRTCWSPRHPPATSSGICIFARMRASLW